MHRDNAINFSTFPTQFKATHIRNCATLDRAFHPLFSILYPAGGNVLQRLTT